MRIELLNEYKATVDLDEYGKESKVYRVPLTLEQLKENLSTVDELIKDSATWTYEGSGMFIYARTFNAQGDINLVRSFYKKDSDLGNWEWYSIEELTELHKKDYLIDVEGYGKVESFDEFKIAYEDVVTKKVAFPLASAYTIAEASYKWGISENTIKERLKISRNKEQIDQYIKSGLVKYFVKPDGKRGDWIISDKFMNKFYKKD